MPRLLGDACLPAGRLGSVHCEPGFQFVSILIREEKVERPREKTVLILGSTGSIGVNALNVIRELSPRYRVVGLSAGSDWELLYEQIREFRPVAAALADDYAKDEARTLISGLDCELDFGDNGICGLVEKVDADIVVGAITGWAGFRPCLRALETGCRLALANKETLVVGGKLVREVAERSGAVVFPVDSEESAIFQAMQAGRRDEVEQVFLTASGGPFHDWPADRLKDVTPRQALCHPNWEMGRKITIDSATLMNKALEIVETRWLFDIEPERIKVLIHPQSLVHSMVEFEDGAIMAQLGATDMKVPIQYALTYPERICGPGERLDFGEMQRFDLRAPAPGEFPALDIGFKVAGMGGTGGAVMNAANEVAVDAFLEGRIGFTDIVKLVGTVVSRHKDGSGYGFKELEQADRRAREETEKCMLRL